MRDSHFQNLKIYDCPFFFLLLFALSLVVACSGGRGSGGATEPDNTPSWELALSGGLNVLVDPFAERDVPNVVLEADENFGEAVFGGVQTVPGVHWSFAWDVPSSISYSQNGAWQAPLGVAPNSSLTPPFRLRYAARMNAARERGWPAVGGGLGENSGSLVASSFVFVLPKSVGNPIRIWFRSKGSPVPIVHSGKSCGSNCVEFSNWAEAIETPISFSREESSRIFVGSSSALPFYVSVVGDVQQPLDWIKSEVAASRAEVLSIWNFLKMKWGTPAVGDAFQTHLMVSGECRHQALEHDASVLAFVGLCESSSFRRELSALVAHEMVHVWNGRHVFPAETAAWNMFAFDSARLHQLYFYEGATEGFSRVAVSENLSQYRDTQMAKWNSTISSLASAGLGMSLQDISTHSPMLGYDAGAFLTLWLAAKTRSSNGGSVDSAKQKFWSVMQTLKQSTGAGVFQIATPLFLRKCARGSLFEPCAGGAGGYSRAHLHSALAESLGISGWQNFVENHMGDVFLRNQAELNAAVSEIAAAAGVSTTANGGRTFFVSTVSGVSGVWPF
jgi:hypothetical protein